MPPVDLVLDPAAPSDEAEAVAAPAGGRPIRGRTRRPRSSRSVRLAAGWLLVLFTAALLSPILPLGEGSDPSATVLEPYFARPSWFGSHPLGTNRFGLDILSRVLHGARVSLLVALAAAALGFVVGGLLGVLAGERRGWLDRLLGVFANSLLAVPGLILLIAVVTVSGKSHIGRTMALALLVVPVNLRLARATTLRVSSADHVTVARILGTPPLRIILREIVPNVVRPLIAYTFVLIPVLIVADASLSFLGLGTPQPDPTWGNMIAEGLEGVFEDHPHIVLVPAAFMFLTVFSLDTVAGHLRSRVDGIGGAA